MYGPYSFSSISLYFISFSPVLPVLSYYLLFPSVPIRSLSFSFVFFSFFLILFHSLSFFPVISHSLPFSPVLSHFLPFSLILSHSLSFSPVLPLSPAPSHPFLLPPILSYALSYSRVPQALWGSGHSVKAIHTRLKGKEGRLRGNLIKKCVEVTLILSRTRLVSQEVLL